MVIINMVWYGMHARSLLSMEFTSVYCSTGDYTYIRIERTQVMYEKIIISRGRIPVLNIQVLDKKNPLTPLRELAFPECASSLVPDYNEDDNKDENMNHCKRMQHIIFDKKLVHRHTCK